MNSERSWLWPLCGALFGATLGTLMVTSALQVVS